MNKKGTVEGINQKDKGYGILVDGQWYNGKGQCGVEKDQEVDFDYTVNGNWKNIDVFKVIESPKEKEITEAKPVTVDNRTDDIHYQVCLKIAGDIISRNYNKDVKGAEKLVAEVVVDLAKEIHKLAW